MRGEGWEFVFSGVDEQSIQDAAAYGFQAKDIFQFDKTGEGTSNAYNRMSSSASTYRNQ